MKIIVDKKERTIKGAQIINYLLEKSRIISQGTNERNFHIFYHFLKGASKETLTQYYLNDIKMEKFEYLNKSNCYDV